MLVEANKVQSVVSSLSMPYVPIQVCNFGLVYIVLVSSNATSFNDLNPTLNDSGAPNATQPFQANGGEHALLDNRPRCPWDRLQRQFWRDPAVSMQGDGSDLFHPLTPH